MRATPGSAPGGLLRVGREGRIGLGAANERERGLQCPVIFRIRRDEGLRALLLLALRLEVPAQTGLALGRKLGLLLRLLLQDFNVGHDPVAWIERPDGVK